MFDERPDQSRPNVFEIDLDAIAGNAREIRRFVGPGVRIFAAMKANGYGFGLTEVAAVLQESGIDTLCVADLSDAARLRASGISLPILLYGGNLADATFVAGVESMGLWPTVTDIAMARSCSLLAHAEMPVFLKVDVGLERLGVRVEDAVDVVAEVVRLPRLRLEGVYTHVHVPGGDDSDDYVRWQLNRFRGLLEAARNRGIVPPVAMAASTPVLPIAGHADLNGIDVGRMVYGSLRADRDRPTSMRIGNAFKSLRSRIIQCKEIRRSEYLAEAPFPTRPGMRMGIAPIGYADGVDSLNCGFALVRGCRVPLLAAPSLEHTRLDLTELPDATVGDEVVFVGKQNGAEITPEEVLRYQGFEQPARMATAVRASVRRVYARSA